MRLAAEIAIGVAAGGMAYVFARPSPPREAPPTASQTTATSLAGRDAPPSAIGAADRRAAVAPAPVTREDPGETRESLAQQAAMSSLRNAVIVESSRDMARRGQNLARCFDGIALAGPEKLRFAVDVESTPSEATLGHWRFVEVVDGEPLPAPFAACAASVLGSGQHVMAGSQPPFPDYRGEISIVYTRPAPDAD